MRTWIIGAAAALAALAAPSIAAAQATGYVDLGYVNSNLEQFGTDTDVDTIVASGSVAFDMGTGLGVQLDARVGNAEPDSGSDIDFWGLGGHVYTRQGDWLFGGYAGFGNIEATGSDIDEWTAALEAQYYLARTTIDGAVSFSETDGGGGTDIETTALDVGVRHFVTDNFSIGGNVGFANVDTGAGGDADATSIGVEAEWQMATLPISIFGGYQRTEVDIPGDLEVDSFGIGVRYNWGGTLFDRDRSGAGLRRRPGGIARILGGVV